MKKRERAKRIDNIVFFPGVELRLKDKGLESLRGKRFAEAIAFLEEARNHEPEDSDILIGLVLAYFESSALLKAKELAKEMLLKGLGDYFQMVDLYLTILIQLHEYEEIVITLEALLEEKEIPPDKHEHFLTILQFSRRMTEQNQSETLEELLKEDLPEEEDLAGLNLLSIHSLNEQMLIISKLANKNIRPYISEIEEYLTAEAGHPFLKSMLLTLLKEQEYDKEIIVEKFNLELKVVPTQLPEISLQPRQIEIVECLGEHLENSNPVLFENIIGMVERTFYVSYPFELTPKQTEVWAAAFHLLGQKYFGMDQMSEDIFEEYQVSSKNIELAIAKIMEIEEISYPNL